MPGPNKLAPSSTTWLDVLPEEVCDRIAEHVTGGRIGHDAVNLAFISRKQSHSAARSLPHPVFVNLDEEFRFKPFLSDEDIVHWANVFAEHPLSVRMSRSTPFAIKLVGVANLGEVSIRADNTELLKSLSNLHSLRKLDLNISCRTDIDLVIAVLSSLTLDVLSIREDNRSFHDLVPFTAASIRCIEACGPSTQFHWIDGNGVAEVTRSYWDAVALLPDSANIDIGAAPSENMREKVSRFQSVKIKWMRPNVAHSLGSAVVSYRNYFMFPSECRALDSDNVIMLQNCPRLQVLSVHVAASAQSAMVDLITHLPCLETLILFWYDSEGARRDRVVELAPGVMRNMLRTSSKLEFLDIGNALVPLLEWEDVLIHLGGHLKFLYVDVSLTKLELCQLALRLLSSISRCCRKMRHFTLYSKMSADEYPEKEDVDSVLHVARHVQQTNPILNEGHLEKDIFRLLNASREDENDCGWITELLRRTSIHGNHMT